MNGPRSEDGDSHGRQKPVRVVKAGTRVTVAFPFSQIKLQEPAGEIKWVRLPWRDVMQREGWRR